METVTQTKPKRQRIPEPYRFGCMECGKRFRSTASAERASLDGCPKCGGVDVDVVEIRANVLTEGGAS